MILTQEQTNLIHRGYGYMVDNGYSQLDTVAHVILTLEVQLEWARREKQISAADRQANPGADTIISFLEPMIANLTSRARLNAEAGR